MEHGCGGGEYSLPSDPVCLFLAKRWVSMLTLTLVAFLALTLTGHKWSGLFIVNGSLVAQACALAYGAIEKRPQPGPVANAAAQVIRSLFYLALCALGAGIVLIPAG